MGELMESVWTIFVYLRNIVGGLLTAAVATYVVWGIWRAGVF